MGKFSKMKVWRTDKQLQAGKLESCIARNNASLHEKVQKLKVSDE